MTIGLMLILRYLVQGHQLPLQFQ